MVSKAFHLRSIERQDCDRLFEWRNKLPVRFVSLNTDVIQYKKHLLWFEKQLKGKGRLNFIFCENDIPSGVVYFEVDVQNEAAEFGFYKDMKNKSRNLGLYMEIEAIKHAFNSLNLRKLTCRVLSNNMKLVSFHEYFGFKIEGCQIRQIKRDNSFLDLYFLGLFSEEWKRIKNHFADFV